MYLVYFFINLNCCLDHTWSNVFHYPPLRRTSISRGATPVTYLALRQLSQEASITASATAEAGTILRLKLTFRAAVADGFTENIRSFGALCPADWACLPNNDLH